MDLFLFMAGWITAVFDFYTVGPPPLSLFCFCFGLISGGVTTIDPCKDGDFRVSLILSCSVKMDDCDSANALTFTLPGFDEAFFSFYCDSLSFDEACLRFSEMLSSFVCFYF